MINETEKGHFASKKLRTRKKQKLWLKDEKLHIIEVNRNNPKTNAKETLYPHQGFFH